MANEDIDLTFTGMRGEVVDAKSTGRLLKIGVLALIQGAQELNEIKHVLAGREQEGVADWLRLQRDLLWPKQLSREHRIVDELIRRYEQGI